jgi:hypothetical protein
MKIRTMHHEDLGHEQDAQQCLEENLQFIQFTWELKLFTAEKPAYIEDIVKGHKGQPIVLKLRVTKKVEVEAAIK